MPVCKGRTEHDARASSMHLMHVCIHLAYVRACVQGFMRVCWQVSKEYACIHTHEPIRMHCNEKRLALGNCTASLILSAANTHKQIHTYTYTNMDT